MTIDYDTFIGGWYISENVCDNLIDVFKHSLINW